MKDLLKQERQWRRVNHQEHKHAPLHISIGGQVHADYIRDNEKSPLSEWLELDKHVSDQWIAEELELCVKMARLTRREMLTFRLLASGCTSSDAAALIGEIEHKQVVPSTYNRRMEKLVKKIRLMLSND